MFALHEPDIQNVLDYRASPPAPRRRYRKQITAPGAVAAFVASIPAVDMPSQQELQEHGGAAEYLRLHPGGRCDGSCKAPPRRPAKILGTCLACGGKLCNWGWCEPCRVKIDAELRKLAGKFKNCKTGSFI